MTTEFAAPFECNTLPLTFGRVMSVINNRAAVLAVYW